MNRALVLVLAFLLGSLPWSLWVGRARGVDMRKAGSGNLGATNVYRVLGARLGVLVLLADVGKGVAAVAMARWVDPFSGFLPAAAGLLAVCGHMASPLAGFRGGKGVATALGAFLGLAPLAGGLSLLVFMSTLALAGWVSVASTTAALVLPIFVFATRDLLGFRGTWALGLALLLSTLVLWRHRGNWARLRDGREQRIWERRAESPETGAEP